MRTAARSLAASTAATASDYGLTLLWVEALGIGVLTGAALGMFTGAVVGFVVNKFWSFRNSGPITSKQCTLYGLVASANVLCVTGGVCVLTRFGIHYLVAKGVASALSFFGWTYPLLSRRVFNEPAPDGFPRL